MLWFVLGWFGPLLRGFGLVGRRRGRGRRCSYPVRTGGGVGMTWSRAETVCEDEMRCKLWRALSFGVRIGSWIQVAEMRVRETRRGPVRLLYCRRYQMLLLYVESALQWIVMCMHCGRKEEFNAKSLDNVPTPPSCHWPQKSSDR